jgi:hypothetical protein
MPRSLALAPISIACLFALSPPVSADEPSCDPPCGEGFECRIRGQRAECVQIVSPCDPPCGEGMECRLGHSGLTCVPIEGGEPPRPPPSPEEHHAEPGAPKMLAPAPVAPPPPTSPTSPRRSFWLIGFERLFGLGVETSATSTGLGDVSTTVPFVAVLRMPGGIFTTPRIGLDFAFGPMITVGASAGFTWVDASDSQATMSQSAYALLLVPRVGYWLQLTRFFALWPRIGFSWFHTHADANATSPQLDQEGFAFTGEVQSLLFVTENVAFSFGLSLDLAISGSESSDMNSLTTTINQYGVLAGLLLRL